MNDLDQLKAIFERAGVKYELHEEHLNHEGNLCSEKVIPLYLRLPASAGPANHGYGCFEAIFHFDKESMLTCIGVWE